MFLPQMECLALVNAVCTRPGWIEWGYQSMNVRHLKSSGMTQGVLDDLMYHHFGKVSGVRRTTGPAAERDLEGREGRTLLRSEDWGRCNHWSRWIICLGLGLA